jgi:hypothetical protein
MTKKLTEEEKVFRAEMKLKGFTPIIPPPKVKTASRLKSESLGYTATGSSWTMADEKKFIDNLGKHTAKNRAGKLTRQESLDRYVTYMAETRFNFDQLSPEGMIAYAREAV